MQQWEPARKRQGGAFAVRRDAGAGQSRRRQSRGHPVVSGRVRRQPDRCRPVRSPHDGTGPVLPRRLRPARPAVLLCPARRLCQRPVPRTVPGWNRVRESQRTWQSALPNVGMVSAIDCGLDDGIHIDTPGLKSSRAAPRRRRVGSACARLALRHLRAERAAGCASRSTNVQGGLQAAGRPAGFTLRDADGNELPLIYKVALDGSDALLKITDPARLPGAPSGTATAWPPTATSPTPPARPFPRLGRFLYDEALFHFCPLPSGGSFRCSCPIPPSARRGRAGESAID